MFFFCLSSLLSFFLSFILSFFLCLSSFLPSISHIHLRKRSDFLCLHPSHAELELSLSPSNLLLFPLSKQKIPSSSALSLLCLHEKYKTPPFIPSLSRVGDIVVCAADQFGNINGELVVTCLLTCNNLCVNQKELPAPFSLTQHRLDS